jgi:hypothetical protein
MITVNHKNQISQEGPSMSTVMTTNAVMEYLRQFPKMRKADKETVAFEMRRTLAFNTGFAYPVIEVMVDVAVYGKVQNREVKLSLA